VAALSQRLKSPALVWGAILLLAWWLRWPLPGPDWQHVDEQAFIDYPLGFWSGDLNPHFFNYPTFHLYLLSALYYLYYLLLSSEPLVSFVAYRYFVDGSDLLALARGLNTLMALGAVATTLCLGRRLYGLQGAWVAGLVLALMPLHVRFSHLAITDVPAAFWISLALLWALRLLQEGRRLDFLLAGLFAGLAAATKYPAGLVLLPVLGAGWHRSPRLAAQTAAIALLCFALATPYAWLDSGRFWSDLSAMGQEHLLDSGHRGADPAWLHLVRYNLRYGMGLAGLVTLLAALAWKPRAWRAEEAVVAVAFGLFALLLLASQSGFMRYALPLAAPAALLMTRLLLGLSRSRLVLAGWLAALLAEPAYASLQTRLLLSGPDTRTQVRQWLAAQPGGTRIVQGPGRAGEVSLFTPGWVYKRQNRFVSSFGIKGLHAAYQALGQRRDLPRLYLLSSLEEVETFAAAQPGEEANAALLLWCDHPLCEGEGGQLEPLESRIRWQSRFAPGGGQGAVFDQADWYFVPIGGWSGVERSGPSVRPGLVPLKLANPAPTAQGFFQLLDHLLSAREAAAQKDWPQALHYYGQVLEKPYRLNEVLTYAFLYRLYMDMGLAHQQQGDHEKAISYWLEAAKARPDRGEAQQQIARAYSALHQPGPSTSPPGTQDPRLLYNLGLSYIAQQRFPEAIAAIEASVARKPDADAYVNLGLLYAKTGQRARARTCYGKALELAPDHPQAGAMWQELLAKP
jgi:tetratricopeptide (TPR) repeat protein